MTLASSHLIFLQNLHDSVFSAQTGAEPEVLQDLRINSCYRSAKSSSAPITRLWQKKYSSMTLVPKHFASRTQTVWLTTWVGSVFLSLGGLSISTFSLVSQRTLKKSIWLYGNLCFQGLKCSFFLLPGYILKVPSHILTVKVTVQPLTTPAWLVFSDFPHLCPEIRSTIVSDVLLRRYMSLL